MTKKIFLLALSVIILVFVLYFGWLVLRYYGQIQRGDLVDLGQGSFSAIKTGASGQTKNTVDLSKIKGTGSPFIGNATAKLQIVEFIDFTCPFSKQAFLVMRELVANYPERVGLTVRHFPLQDEAHKGGLEASVASVCAGLQGKFWAYHDKLFQNQKNFTKDDLLLYSGQIGLDVPSFTKCLDSEEAKKKVENDWGDGFGLELNGTPTFFVNGQKVEGAVPLSAWENIVTKIK
ncbi:MAG: thioredoxin domain-containing protein [Candidatus Magasanikbacteria bacterium]|nr:thioredoxin domain-containing protein [Candidatus Magasanikbacteria bacterium]